MCADGWRVSPKLLKLFSNLFTVAVHYTHQHVLCIASIADCIHVCTPVAHQNIYTISCCYC